MRCLRPPQSLSYQPLLLVPPGQLRTALPQFQSLSSAQRALLAGFSQGVQLGPWCPRAASSPMVSIGLALVTRVTRVTSIPQSPLTIAASAEMDRYEVVREFGLWKRQTGCLFARSAYGQGQKRSWFKRADVQVGSVRLSCSHSATNSSRLALQALVRRLNAMERKPTGEVMLRLKEEPEGSDECALRTGRVLQRSLQTLSMSWRREEGESDDEDGGAADEATDSECYDYQAAGTPAADLTLASSLHMCSPACCRALRRTRGHAQVSPLAPAVPEDEHAAGTVPRQGQSACRPAAR